MRSIRSFIDELERAGDLVRVGEYVNPELEITEIADREMKKPGGGKALLFENNGSRYPLIINMYGSESRIAKALYCKADPSEKSEEMAALFKALSSPKNTFGDKLRTLPLLKDISGYFPKKRKGRGVCQEVVDEEIDIFSLPVLKCWPYDGGKFMTLPMVNTIDPETGIRNVGMYRVQLLDRQTTAMHWHLHKTGARHYQQYKKLGRRMPCAIVLGGDPVYAYCATAPLPDGIDEYLLAGFLRGKAVGLVKCLTQPDIYVPEDADFVIEGYVNTDEELVLEGPFGDHTGFYSLADYYPKFHITCITHKKDAVYPATIVGVPPMEDAYISLATEKIFRFPITMAFAPEMLDLHMPHAGVEHNLTLVKIKNQYPGNALKIKNAMWGAGQMMFNKILVVYSGDEDLRDYQKFLADALSRFVPMRDVHIGNNGVSDVLDHSSRRFVCGGKMCLDCTGGVQASLPADDSDGGQGCPHSKYIKVVPVSDKLSPVRNIAEFLLSAEGGCQAKIMIFVDEGLPLDDWNLVVWYAAGNVDPAVDCFVIDDGRGGCLCMDATAKTRADDGFRRDWPEVVVMDDATIKSVDGKKIGEMPPSPSIKLQKLRYNNGAVKFFNSSD
ncbi:MAG: menaquinone biosynthesis decarboxylase [Bacteroidales bacterium]|nr:menaquinone biosynthesis decarboxylase [Bacteroidales bacterium]